MRALLTAGYVNAGDMEWTGAPLRAWTGRGAMQMVIYCHGAGQTVLGIQKDVDAGLSRGLAEDHIVRMGDYGGDTWGNDYATDRVHNLVLDARANMGSVGKVIMIGTSMGALTSCNYLRRHPENVKAVALCIPATDIQDIINISGGSGTTNIDAAYPPSGYRDNIEGQTYSPIHMVQNQLIPANFDTPIKIWSLPTDVLTTPAAHRAFVAARPGTEIEDIPTTYLGTPVYHGAIAVAAAQDSIAAWVRKQAA